MAQCGVARQGVRNYSSITSRLPIPRVGFLTQDENITLNFYFLTYESVTWLLSVCRRVIHRYPCIYISRSFLSRFNLFRLRIHSYPIAEWFWRDELLLIFHFQFTHFKTQIKNITSNNISLILQVFCGCLLLTKRNEACYPCIIYFQSIYLKTYWRRQIQLSLLSSFPRFFKRSPIPEDVQTPISAREIVLIHVTSFEYWISDGEIIILLPWTLLLVYEIAPRHLITSSSGTMNAAEISFFTSLFIPRLDTV